MQNMTTISVFKETRKLLEERKSHPRQSMDEVIRDLLAKTSPAGALPPTPAPVNDQEVSPHALPTTESPE